MSFSASGLPGWQPACQGAGGGSAKSSASPSGHGAKKGGTLRAAFVGAGSAETLNPLLGPTFLDSVRIRAVHGLLGVLDSAGDNGVRLDILSSITPSKDLTSYTLTLRDKAVFTDGSPVTARDIAYSLAAPLKLPSLPYMKTIGASFNVAKAKVVNDRTLGVPTLTPIADGAMVLCQNTVVLKEGTTSFTESTPTCGPFKIKKFVAGEGTSLVRFDGYYGAEPLLDGLELRSIADLDARVSALTSGQIDYAGDIGPVKARTLNGNSAVALDESAVPFVTALSFIMNMNDKAFSDVRVRQAFRLAVDRKKMLSTALGGKGVLGNDLESIGFPDYADGIEQRTRDVAKATKLLSDAGAAGMSVTLLTGSEIQGMAEASAMLVENLKDVGVTVKLDSRPQGQLFADMKSYFSASFVANYTPPNPLLSGYTSTHVAGLPSTFGFNRPDIDKLMLAARGQASAQERKAKAVQAQKLIWEQGNSILPVFAATVNARAAGVHGVLSDPWPTFAKASIE
ncbi:MAG: ABC transporter substrate-binding protein [Acidipropionibacterium sp.]|jgi:peptide/nickel transport system substrate-binding protein|nr:ABC transporter substrate-binding protein [Acidipropionibacterium sp.]